VIGRSRLGTDGRDADGGSCLNPLPEGAPARNDLAAPVEVSASGADLHDKGLSSHALDDRGPAVDEGVETAHGTMGPREAGCDIRGQRG